MTDHDDDDDRLPATRRQMLKVTGAAVGTGTAAGGFDAGDATEIDPDPERVRFSPDGSLTRVVDVFDRVSRVRVGRWYPLLQAAAAVNGLDDAAEVVAVGDAAGWLPSLGWPHRNRLAEAVDDGRVTVSTVREPNVSPDNQTLVVGRRDGQPAVARAHAGARQWVVTNVPRLDPHAASDGDGVTRDVTVSVPGESRVRQALDDAPDAVREVVDSLEGERWRTTRRPSAPALAGWGFSRAGASRSDAVAWARRTGVDADLVRTVFDEVCGFARDDRPVDAVSPSVLAFVFDVEPPNGGDGDGRGESA